MKRSSIISGFAGFAAVLMITGSAWAMGSSDTDESQQVDAYKQAKSLIDDDKYSEAIPILQKLIKDKGAYADALNLLGYSYRKSGDATTALDYYNQALAMEPKHLGANEYLGELYLEMKQPDKAKERLAVLKNACGDCEEYEELEDAIKKQASM
ncbi:tetratricopeptide repeat protein [Dongia sedimenti]|uniref:Tetratricopeptide repeat protein n=1 Tax=Dongia sedimenti TaxID=3064282 RepID=A0ABU0YS44_9PROT|nr:tetratricopeptide repeat protein [Rhodospirillaceae bacterium R-7]